MRNCRPNALLRGQELFPVRLKIELTATILGMLKNKHRSKESRVQITPAPYVRRSGIKEREAGIQAQNP